MPTLSVVIPTFNNAHSIGAVIEALSTQVVPTDWWYEIVVSDDGSTDTTLAMLPPTLPPAWRLTVVKRPHAGAAAARNYGVTAAHGDIILLVGADIILQPGAVAAHVAFHREHPAAAAAGLGFVQWDPRVNPSPFMEWMTHGGQQNNYDALLGQLTASPEHFLYGSHVSLKKGVLVDHPFSDRFRHYGWEDLDLGRRLAQVGVTLTVLAAARGLHAHYYSVTAICRRQQQLGRSILLYQALHPQSEAAPPFTHERKIKVLLARWSGVMRVLTHVLQWTARRWSTPRLFALVTTMYFWQGVYLERGKQ